MRFVSIITLLGNLLLPLRLALASHQLQAASTNLTIPIIDLRAIEPPPVAHLTKRSIDYDCRPIIRQIRGLYRGHVRVAHSYCSSLHRVVMLCKFTHAQTRRLAYHRRLISCEAGEICVETGTPRNPSPRCVPTNQAHQLFVRWAFNELRERSLVIMRMGLYPAIRQVEAGVSYFDLDGFPKQVETTEFYNELTGEMVGQAPPNANWSKSNPLDVDPVDGVEVRVEITLPGPVENFQLWSYFLPVS